MQIAGMLYSKIGWEGPVKALGVHCPEAVNEFLSSSLVLNDPTYELLLRENNKSGAVCCKVKKFLHWFLSIYSFHRNCPDYLV